MKKHAVVSLSGGLDSTTVLLHALVNYDTVTAISFDYGQKHRVELERAKDCVDYINTKSKVEVVRTSNPPSKGEVQLFNPINYQVIKLDGLTPLLSSALVEGGDEVPEGHYEQENMKETVVPNRNKIFSSITQAVALSIANKYEEPVDVLMGIHAGDHAIYPDCRQEFRDADENAFRIGNWNSDRVYFKAPYLHTDKLGILEDGLELCKSLGLNFDEVYKRTNTSYKPIRIEYPMGATMEDFRNGPDVEWFSDYKSASSVERIEAFIKLGRPDPVRYADETGPVTWDKVKSHVEKVLAEHGK